MLGGMPVFEIQEGSKLSTLLKNEEEYDTDGMDKTEAHGMALLNQMPAKAKLEHPHVIIAAKLCKEL